MKYHQKIKKISKEINAISKDNTKNLEILIYQFLENPQINKMKTKLLI